MSAQVQGNSFTNIGRMFARRNVPAVYGAQRDRPGAGVEEAAGMVDTVSLSASAPRPLSATFLEQAVDVSRRLGEGSRLSADSDEKLREDRIFGAMVALASIGGDDPKSMPRNWPAGLPAPTRGEMDAARRRLSQRLRDLELVGDPTAVQQTRLDLLGKVGKIDFSGMTSDAGGGEATVATVSGAA